MEIRIPRPTGVTKLASNFRKSKTSEAKRALYQKITSHYVNFGFHYCGIKIAFSELSDKLKFPNQFKASSVVSELASVLPVLPEESTLAQQCLGLALEWTMNDRGIVQDTVNEMVGFFKRTGKGSKAAIDSISRMQASVDQLLAISTKLLQHRTTIIQIGDQKEANSKFLTAADALELLNKDEEQNPKIALQSYIEGIPDVKAEVGSEAAISTKSSVKLNEDLIRDSDELPEMDWKAYAKPIVAPR